MAILVKNGRSNGDELFKEGPRIIDNPQLLSSAFVPDTLVHRDAEIKELANLLRHAARGGTPGNVLITGPSGSGKTVVVKYVMRKLKEAAERSGDAQTLCLVYVVASATPYRILKDLAEGCGSKLPKKGLSFEDGWGVVEDALRGKRALLVLDEIDKYVEKDPEAKVLYRLTRRPDTCLVLISNLQPAPLLDLIEEQKVRSRLAGATRMNFLPYNAMHLKDIIHERVKLGALAAGTAEQGAVELCAALAVARQGDAAYALNLFEMAARTAESEGARGLEIKHVKIADQIVEESHVREAINNMAPGKKLILLLLAQRGPTTPTEIYTRVGNQFSGALGKISRRWRAEYLRELQADGFVVNERVGKRSGRGGVGWKASISPSYDRKTLEAYLIEAMPGVKTDKEPGSNMYG